MSMETDRIEADVQQSRHRLKDTLSQLGSKISPGQMLDEGIGLIQGQAGQFAGKLGRQVRDNPLPIALVGVGVAWLILSNRHSSSADEELESEERYHQKRYRTIEEARWATPRLPNETDEAYEERVNQAYAKALDLKQLAGEAAHEFKERVKRTVEGIQYAATRAGSRIGRTVMGAGRRIGEAATQTGERMSHLASDAKHLAEEQAQRLSRTAVEARYGAERYYDESPLTVGAIAVALGAILGSVTPLSSPERRTLRGVADSAVRTGADLAERGARAVEEGVDRAFH
jgi:hypothetical protein